jgi:VanZ family protein
MIFIGVSSTDLMSAEHTSRFIGPFLRWFDPNISEATIASVQLFVRKCAHLSEYAILAAFLCRALRQSQPRLLRVAIIAFVVAAICAALDEFHQSFVTTRTGTPWDVAIDCAGALIGLALFWLVSNRKSKLETRK